jgi:hypothetical protein
MILSLQRTLHPAWYQGHGKKAPYFEGWYYKLIDSSEQHRLAVIPGIFKGADPSTSHAFVQVLDGMSGEATYHEYPAQTFRAAKEGLEVHVGPNRFTLHTVTLDIDTSRRSVRGTLGLSDLTPWPTTVTSPGVMGFFAWIPFLQTYHGVVSLDHVIDGSLTFEGETIDFSDGRGYVEKDWGRSFPEAWIWMQTNHFDQPGISFTASIAVIPLLGFSLRGLIVGLWHGGDLYRFATYTGAQIDELTISDEEVQAVISDSNHRLEITARRAKGGVLRGPTGLDMGARVPESLRATVTVRLSALDRGGSGLLFEGTGRNAGLEVVGEVSKLLG